MNFPRAKFAFLPLIFAAALCAVALAPGQASAQPANDRAAETGALTEAAAGLTAKSYKKKEAAIDAIGAAGDPRAIPLLKALGAGKLYLRASDKRLFIIASTGDGYALTDALNGAKAGTATRGEMSKIRVNNRLRRAIKSALGALELFSDDPARRIAAAENAAKYGGEGIAALLTKALAAETDEGARKAIRFALLTSRVETGSEDARIKAINELSDSTDAEARALIGKVAADANAPPKVRAAAEQAVEKIEGKLFYLELALNLFQGISLGSVLLLAAIGLAITFGVMGVINMAHGEMIMLGAYTTFVVQEIFRAAFPGAVDWYLLAALPAGFVVAGAVGIALERGVIQFLYGRPLETLLATWGISLVLQQVVRSIFGAPNKEVANPTWMTGGIELAGGMVLTYNRLCIILFAFIVIGALALLMRRTAYGLNMRAVTQNRRMAASMGIPTARVDALTFGLGSGIAGIAGVALSQIGNVSPNLGQLYIVDSFMVVVFGGVGNIAGTLVGAMTLGIINKFLEPFAGAVLGKVVVLVIIILFIQRRPQGLFALKGRSAEL